MGFENQPPQPPTWPMMRQRFSATIGNDDAGMGDSLPLFLVKFLDFEVQPWQPPNPLRFPYTRSGALARWDDGNYFKEVRFFVTGWEIQPWQPPHLPKERRGAGWMRGDDGTLFTEKLFFIPGWEVQSVQPPHPIPERRAGALMRGDDGNLQVEFAPPTEGPWTDQNWSPPHFAPERRSAAIARDDDGDQFIFYYPRYNFELPFLSLNPKPRFKSPEFGSQGIEAPVPIPYVGWDAVLADQIMHRRWPAGLMQATTLIEILGPPPDAATWAIDTTEFIKYRRNVPGLEIEPSYLPEAFPIPFGYDHLETLFPRKMWKAFPIGDVIIPRIPPIIWGFDGTDRFPGYHRRYAAALERDAEYFSTFPPHVWGHEPVLPFFRPGRVRYTLDRGQELNSALPYSFFVGWDVQSWQPPSPLPRRDRFESIARGDEGIEQVEIVPFPNGWEPLGFWPSHPRSEKAGAIMIGDTSAIWPFVYLVPSGAIAFDFPINYIAAWDIGLPP